MNPTASRREYLGRINRVLDHIEGHIDEPLRLEGLAHVAAFSPFHFHRVFRGLMGETVAHCIQRMRLERAAGMLTWNSEEPISNIALECGFSSPAHFARAFKAHFGATASEFRAAQERKQEQRPDRKERAPTAGEPPAAGVALQRLAPMRVAYIRHWGDYHAPSLWAAWERLAQWATAHELLGPGAELVGIPHDDPEVTPLERCRYDAGVQVGPEQRPSGEVAMATLEGGLHAVWACELHAEGILEAWNQLFGGWLPHSGFQPATGPCFELYGQGEPLPDGRWAVRFCLPVRPL